ncbi:MAG: flagellar basal-body rod protein FlgG [Acidobacteria bacterium]|nr:MAG: flagellar basal-body rod protein FlgG [Acidobacteriota bacterium]
MFQALHTAASGMLAQQMDLDNIANNLANASTAGFRRRRLQFEDLLYQNLVASGSASTQQTTVSSGLEVGMGTRPSSTEMVSSQGSLDTTNNPLDLAIEGAGFFQIQMPDGTTAYTRSGSFHLDANGSMVTADGYPLQPPVAVPLNATALSIGKDGTVTATVPGSAQAQQVGTITLATFANVGGLESKGANLFAPTTASGDPIVGTPGGNQGLGTIQQGELEESNVNVVDQFVQMIEAQRSYEANSRVVQAADQMQRQLNNLQ